MGDWVDMKRLSFILMAALTVLTSCDEEVTVRTTGTDTIDNTTYTERHILYMDFRFNREACINRS